MDYSTAHKYFTYVNGNLYWKITVGSRAIAENKAGKLRKDGYYDVGLCGKYYLIHRIVYLMHYNYLPSIIDHINRNRKDNRIENLRESDVNKNTWNSSTSLNNRLGIKGIRLTKTGKYEARVACAGKTYQVGTFSSISEAEKAIQQFRENIHGNFYCHG